MRNITSEQLPMLMMWCVFVVFGLVLWVVGVLDWPVYDFVSRVPMAGYGLALAAVAPGIGVLGALCFGVRWPIKVKVGLGLAALGLLMAAAACFLLFRVNYGSQIEMATTLWFRTIALGGTGLMVAGPLLAIWAIGRINDAVVIYLLTCCIMLWLYGLIPHRLFMHCYFTEPDHLMNAVLFSGAMIYLVLMMGLGMVLNKRKMQFKGS